ISVGANERVGLLASMLEYDIDPKALLYNDYVLRAFADRTLTTSPIAAQCAGDDTDRYSVHFVDMLGGLVANLDSGLTYADHVRIDKHAAILKAISDDRN